MIDHRSELVFVQVAPKLFHYQVLSNLMLLKKNDFVVGSDVFVNQEAMQIFDV